jgi:hypothetical protein
MSTKMFYKRKMSFFALTYALDRLALSLLCGHSFVCEISSTIGSFDAMSSLPLFTQADLKDLLTPRARNNRDSVRSGSTRTTITQFQRCGSGNCAKFIPFQMMD